MPKLNKLLTITFFVIFLVLGIATLPHYGINWDTINHLPRGQAYFHYFLTGNKDYSDLPEWKMYWQNPKSLSINSDLPKSQVKKRSFYQSVGMPFNWMIENEGGSSGGGHPPLSDILSTSFNYVLFQKLGVINDIDAYRVYGVFLAALLVGLSYWWVSKKYGVFGAIIAALSLATYPLFWSESHFNTEKDIPETVFISLMLFFFWQGMVEKKGFKILLAGLFFGLALGTKFNVLFTPFIALPWLIIYWGKRWWKEKQKLLLSMVGALILGIAIYILSWPYLWQHPLKNSMKVMEFYKGIGLTQKINKDYVGPFKINTYPAQWVIYTTPPIILFLALIGLLSMPMKIKKEKDKLSLLILLWLAIPILRVTAPGMTIYGGIRQIMEYIPPLAVMAGMGATTVLSLFRLKWQKLLVGIAIFIAFGIASYRLITIFPNENVYFNFLIGGLEGAKDRNIPAWGNSFGAAYRQGVIWLNKNAPPNSDVVMAHGLMPNIPKIWLRPDLHFTNGVRSGYLRRGEYAISLISEGTEDRSYYDMYLSKFLEPVYEAKVDNVAILKIWKNDEQHLLAPSKETIWTDVKMEKSDLGLRFDLGEIKKLSRLEIEYQEGNCQPLTSAYVGTSINNKDWGEMPEKLPQAWTIAVLGQQPKDGKFIEPFVGQQAQFIKLDLLPFDTCLKYVIDYRIFIFD